MATTDLLLGPITTTSLIFGGCCSNVFALEHLIHASPSSGLLITFVQWLLATSFAYLTQLDFPSGATNPLAVRRPKVPISRWALIAGMFFVINILNNWAFAFRISVPVHIILRSFGSVTTMCMGWSRGKRYSALQVGSVAVLTVGVLVAAFADSARKGSSMTLGSESSTLEFTMGLGILLLAQLMSAYMGAFVEDTYALYKADWTENLFYSHMLSLPLFLPLAGTLRRQWAELAATPPLDVHSQSARFIMGLLPDGITKVITRLPRGMFFLALNATTQLACISGVNLLSSKSSAVTVTIVLNIRKLVSFILSTVLFGHQLDNAMLLGSVMVFGSGALYGWETSWRLPRQRRRLQAEQKEKMNGRAKAGGSTALGSKVNGSVTDGSNASGLPEANGHIGANGSPRAKKHGTVAHSSAVNGSVKAGKSVGSGKSKMH